MGNSRNRRTENSRFVSVLRDYRFEIIGAAIAALGIFLLLERMSIRSTVFGWLADLFRAIIDSLVRLGDSLSEGVSSLTLSDMVGLLLIFGALIIIGWRIRWRLMRAPSLCVLRCPKCGSSLHRVHRRFVDRFANVFIPVRRYRCDNRQCRWEGLRVGVSHRTPSRSATGQEAAGPLDDAVR